MLDLFSRPWAVLQAGAPWLCLALLLFCCAWWSLWSERKSRFGRGILLCAVLSGAIAWSLHLGWMADDAFISFRYARNWVEGMGLVFNPGERVEGYTNFLWIILLGPFHAFGLSLPQASVALTVACFALTLWFSARFSGKLQERLALARSGWSFPIAAAFLALNYTFASFGTSGLETMFATLLLLLALERAEHGAPLASGALAIGATLAHPDHAIFYACLACVLLLQRQFRALLLFALPFAVIYVPYFAWRWSYYGDFFPNTYYVKNASGFYFSQGLRYLLVSGMSSGLWAALPLAAYAMWHLREARISRFCALAVPAFLTYVAKIGGDFMLGRLLCPLLPPVYILAELGLRSLAKRRAPALSARVALALGVFSLAVVPLRVVPPKEVFAQVADERTFYPIGSYLPFSLESSYWHWAHAFNRTFSGLSRKPVLAMYSVGIVSYETGLQMVDNAGLNHREVAHWRIRHRGRPGHEKIISPGLLVKSDADVSDVAVYPKPYEQLGRVNIDGVRFHTVKYDARLFSELALAGVEPPPLLRYIEDYVPANDPSRLECDLWHMQQIYFWHDPSSPLLQPLLRKVIAARPGWAEYLELLLSPSSPEAASWRRVDGLDFDEFDPLFELTGDAFEHNPVRREAVGQPPLAGTRGGFIDSFQDESGDLAIGALTRSLVISGDVITLEVGGGYHPEETYVELLVGGRRFHATGCNSGILGRRLWNTRGAIGERALLRIVDQRRGEFGHIIVDDLVQWRSLRAAPFGSAAHVSGADGGVP